MPTEDGSSSFETLIEAFYAQADVAAEHWHNVLSQEQPLKKALENWKRETPTKNAQTLGPQGKLTFYALSSTEFAEQDTVISNISRSMKDYFEAVQEMQASFSKATNEAMRTGGDIGGHGDAITVASDHMDTIVAQATAANTAWQQGLAQFLPRYTKAKLQLLELGTKFKKSSVK